MIPRLLSSFSRFWPKVRSRVALWVTLVGLFVLVTLTVRLRLTTLGWHGDAAWSMLIGQWEVHHAQIFHENPIGWNGRALHRPWIDVEWGWQWILGTIGFSSRLWILPSLAAVGYVASILWAWAPLRARRPSVILPVIAVLIAWIPERWVWTFRPTWFSISAWALLLGIALRARTQPRWRLAVIPLMALWANLHGDFLLILALLVFEGTWAAWDRIGMLWTRRAPWPWPFAITTRAPAYGRYWALSVLGSLGTLAIATPNHWRTLTYSVWLSR